MTSPLVSVLMTVFNGGSYLRPAVESVLSQTNVNFEFVIVEDCSSDNTRDVLLAYNDKRIKLVLNSSNVGQTSSLNIGLQKCSASWIARVDADDIALPGWLESQHHLVRQYDHLAVASIQAGVINQDGWVRQLLEIPQGHQGMMLRSLTASPFNHGGSWLSREIVLRYGGYDTSYRILADQDLWCRMIRGGENFAAGGRPLMAVRFHEGSISTVQRERLACAETIRVMRHHYEFMTGRFMAEDVLSGLWRLCYFAEQLPVGELDHWLGILRGIFKSVRQGGLTAQQLDDAFRLRARVFCVKRALAFLEGGDTAAVHRVCSLSDAMTGPSRWTNVLRCAAFCGFPGRGLRTYFDAFRAFKAALALGRWRLL